MTLRKCGFTLIELVIVILLLGIVAAYAMPKWLGTGGAQIRTTTDELVSRLRLVQLMNMNEPKPIEQVLVDEGILQIGRCTFLRIDPGALGHRSMPPKNESSGEEFTRGCDAPSVISEWESAATKRGRVISLPATVILNGQSSFTLRFDRQYGKACGSGGCPGEKDGSWLCPSGCNIVVGTGGEARTVRIESEGYIHALP